MPTSNYALLRDGKVIGQYASENAALKALRVYKKQYHGEDYGLRYPGWEIIEVEPLEYWPVGPGKFEGEGTLGERLYEMVMDGWCEDIGDEFFGVYSVLNLFGKPLLVYGDNWGEPTIIRGAIVFERENGFVDVETYTTREEYVDAVAKLEAEYEDFLGGEM